MWHIPEVRDFFGRVAAFSRLIIFDRRGVGLSDTVPRNAIPTWEDLAEDANAVLDAAGSNEAAICVTAESGPMALFFAAMHPERVTALVLFSSFARLLVADDYPIGMSPEDIDLQVAAVRELWGTEALVRLVLPEAEANDELVAGLAAMFRASATPRAAAAQFDYLYRRVDARRALPLIKVPTVVLHPRDAAFVSAELARYVAEHIEGARFVEVPGAEIGFVGETAERLIEEIAELLTGERPVEVERVLATVLFTDVVESTKQAATLGDRRWHSLLDAHDRAVREQLRRFRGREINTTGDGFVASFDGPARAIRCAQAVADATQMLGIDVRSGLHTGECEVRGDDLGGLSVHVAARVGSIARPGEVLVSGTVKDLVVGSGIDFEDRGEHELKGVPGAWRLYSVVS
jgi:class 3 adenylate cyclase